MQMQMPPKKIPDAEGCTVTMYNKFSKCLICAIINLLYLHNEVSDKCYSAPLWSWPMPMPMPLKKIPDAEGCTVTMSDKLSKSLVCAIINLL
jgi:lysyl-tRNA synthetase class I